MDECLRLFKVVNKAIKMEINCEKSCAYWFINTFTNLFD